MAAGKARAAKRPRKKAADKAAPAAIGASAAAKPKRASKRKARAKKTKVPPAPAAERASRYTVRRGSSLPPAQWASRCKDAPWPSEPWQANTTDAARAQELMLLAYWFADQFENPALSDARRVAMQAATKRAVRMLVADVPEMATWVVATAVRCHGALMVQAHDHEKKRIHPGAVLEALLDAHTEQAVHDTLEQVQTHSPAIAAWLRELERRGRSELRVALSACGATPFQPQDEAHREALRRLLALVLFATERAAPGHS